MVLIDSFSRESDAEPNAASRQNRKADLAKIRQLIIKYNKLGAQYIKSGHPDEAHDTLLKAKLLFDENVSLHMQENRQWSKIRAATSNHLGSLYCHHVAIDAIDIHKMRPAWKIGCRAFRGSRSRRSGSVVE